MFAGHILPIMATGAEHQMREAQGFRQTSQLVCFMPVLINLRLVYSLLTAFSTCPATFNDLWTEEMDLWTCAVFFLPHCSLMIALLNGKYLLQIHYRILRVGVELIWWDWIPHQNMAKHELLSQPCNKHKMSYRAEQKIRFFMVITFKYVDNLT